MPSKANASKTGCWAASWGADYQHFAKAVQTLGRQNLAMQVLFVDGIGGARFFRGKLLRRLAEGGHEPSYFSYFTALASFPTTYSRLADRIAIMALKGEYALIGYSFGGVLARAALQNALAGVAPPKHLFLLGSPVRALRLSKSFQGCIAYRFLTGDCGQVVASPRRMGEITLPNVPTTSIVGTRSIPGLSRFVGASTSNDGMVSSKESCPHRFTDAAYLDVSHPWLPDSRQAWSIVLNRLACSERPSEGG